MPQVILTTGTSWTTPSDWDNLNNYIEATGAGGNGGACPASDPTVGAGAGGGGAYASIRGLTLTPGASVTYTLGGPGVPVQFNSSSTLVADSGVTNGNGGGAGGQSSNCVGTVKYSGGNGGSGYITSGTFCSGGGGGGAASKNGAGVAGTGGTISSSGSGGASGSGLAGGASVGGGSGIAGSPGTEYTTVGSGSGGSGAVSAPGLGGAGGAYGAGGGGTSMLYASSGGAGGGGFIVITYAPAPTLTLTGRTYETPCGGATAASFSWNAVSNAASYDIWRSTTNGSGYTLLANQSGTTYTDSTTVATTTYYYVVTSVLAGINSAYSNQITVTGLPTVMPNVSTDEPAFFTSLP